MASPFREAKEVLGINVSFVALKGLQIWIEGFKTRKVKVRINKAIRTYQQVLAKIQQNIKTI